MYCYSVAVVFDIYQRNVSCHAKDGPKKATLVYLYPRRQNGEKALKGTQQGASQSGVMARHSVMFAFLFGILRHHPTLIH